MTSDQDFKVTFWSQISEKWRVFKTKLLFHTNRKLYLTYGMVLYVWWPWLTSKRVARVCQHQLILFLSFSRIQNPALVIQLTLPWYVVATFSIPADRWISRALDNRRNIRTLQLPLYYLAKLCVSAMFAVARCPSVCLSRSCIVSRRLKISSNFSFGPVAHHFSFFDPAPLPNSKGTLQPGAPAGFQARVGKIRREAPKKKSFTHPGFQFAHPACHT